MVERLRSCEAACELLEKYNMSYQVRFFLYDGESSSHLTSRTYKDNSTMWTNTIDLNLVGQSICSISPSFFLDGDELDGRVGQQAA